MQYLQSKGYRVIPVNPRFVGKKILNETVFSSIAEIPEEIDMVDIFRASSQVGSITDEILNINIEKAMSVVWMQIGVRDDASAKRLENSGIAVVMDRCPKIEYDRIFGGLCWNDGIFAKKRK
jgi:predicted CoA-binding protein